MLDTEPPLLRDFALSLIDLSWLSWAVRNAQPQGTPLHSSPSTYKMIPVYNETGWWDEALVVLGRVCEGALRPTGLIRWVAGDGV
jgi:hypothetical protein